jgi:hypothetical protein
MPFETAMSRHSNNDRRRDYGGLRGLFAGGVLCGSAAIATSAVAAGHAWQVWTPLMFSAVPLLIALLYGVRAGVLGTLVAALVFALFLFAPTGGVHVTNSLARSNLGWMLLIGIAFSLLFAPPASGLRRR